MKACIVVLVETWYCMILFYLIAFMAFYRVFCYLGHGLYVRDVCIFRVPRPKLVEVQ